MNLGSSSNLNSTGGSVGVPVAMIGGLAHPDEPKQPKKRKSRLSAEKGHPQETVELVDTRDDSKSFSEEQVKEIVKRALIASKKDEEESDQSIGWNG